MFLCGLDLAVDPLGGFGRLGCFGFCAEHGDEGRLVFGAGGPEQGIEWRGGERHELGLFACLPGRGRFWSGADWFEVLGSGWGNGLGKVKWLFESERIRGCGLVDFGHDARGEAETVEKGAGVGAFDLLLGKTFEDLGHGDDDA
jgi:hypothetical protein